MNSEYSCDSGVVVTVLITKLLNASRKVYKRVGLGKLLHNIKCTMNNCESEEIVEAANIAISNLLPTKS
ncbi:hypothetical protein NQ317_005770 [Molorchus minor]|uniref:Uncharacterized protein n=1 Tax=Molorchus minor TaxID=1323400 RepID=A0ABQ9JCU1_9CUCU|nr:hypothetical protein NQ317_005770 [Molorchus minor]